MSPIDISQLSETEREALDALVHETASDTASNAINNSEQIDFLLANGFDESVIRERMSEMVMSGDGSGEFADPQL